VVLREAQNIQAKLFMGERAVEKLYYLVLLKESGTVMLIMIQMKTLTRQNVMRVRPVVGSRKAS
jgi:hypothetical protein